MTVGVKLAIGAQFWLDGAAWTVHELAMGSVVLVAGERVTRVSINRLAADAIPLEVDTNDDGDRLPIAAVLGSVSGAAVWPFHGVPQTVLVKHEDLDALAQ
jgi:putative transposase